MSIDWQGNCFIFKMYQLVLSPYTFSSSARQAAASLGQGSQLGFSMPAGIWAPTFPSQDFLSNINKRDSMSPPSSGGAKQGLLQSQASEGRHKAEERSRDCPPSTDQ